MNPKRIAWRAVQVVLVVTVLALLVGQLLGQPLLLSYVTTGSMEPTLSPGDGFVALPTELTGTPAEGDVVVFEAEEIQGGGLTTHRIVGETERGFETKGDANPFTDQDSDEPPVERAEVVAVAWRPDGEVLAIPYVGDAVTGVQSGLQSAQLRLAQLLGTDSLLGVQGLAYLLFAASILLYLVDLLLTGSGGEQRSRSRSRSTTRSLSNRRIVLALTLVVLAGVTAAMVLPAGTNEFNLISAEFESDSPDVVEQGTSESYDYEVNNGGILPSVVIFEETSDNIAVENSQVELSPRSSKQTNLTLTAPPETGNYQLFLQERRYLGILPSSTLFSLHEVHPWLPILVINVIVGVPFYVFGMALLGRGQTRLQTRERPSLRARIRARFR